MTAEQELKIEIFDVLERLVEAEQTKQRHEQERVRLLQRLAEVRAQAVAEQAAPTAEVKS